MDFIKIFIIFTILLYSFFLFFIHVTDYMYFKVKKKIENEVKNEIENNKIKVKKEENENIKIKKEKEIPEGTIIPCEKKPTRYKVGTVINF